MRGLHEHDGCLFPGCDKIHHAHGYCAGHDNQINSKISLMPLKKFNQFCLFEACGKQARSFGYCGPHRRQIKEGRPLKPIIVRDRTPPSGKCEIEGCNNPKKTMGMCKPHYDKTRNKKEEIQKVALKSQLKRHYSLDVESYYQISSSQNNSCAICKKPSTELTKRLAVDHDHNTLEIRGLLCGSCNTGLGLFDDSIDLLLEAASYLEKNRAKLRIVEGKKC